MQFQQVRADSPSILQRGAMQIAGPSFEHMYIIKRAAAQSDWLQLRGRTLQDANGLMCVARSDVLHPSTAS